MGMRCFAPLLLLPCLAFAEDKKPTLEEKIADSKPLELEVVAVKKGDAVLQVTPILMEKPFVTDWFADGPRSLRVDGDKLQAWFKQRGDKDSIQAFVLPKAGGKLAYDSKFGDKGIAKYDREHRPKSDWKPKEDYGDWGDSIKSRPLGDLVGKPHKSEEKEKGQLLKIEDAQGKAVAELGFVDKDNKLCWLHNFCRYKDIVFLVDGNCRKIGVWTIEGKQLFNIECRELGLDYPWVQSIDVTEKGELYLGFTQKRKKADGKGNSEIQEAAFLKITGLDSIKTAPQ